MLFRSRIAAQLAARGGALPRIASHWQAAGRWAQAGQAFSDAAAQIGKQLRNFEEAALLEQAAACWVAAGDAAAEAEVCWRLHWAQWRRKDRPAMRAAVARLQALREVSPQARWHALAAAGQLGFDERHDEASLQQVIQARALAESLGDAGPALWLLSVQAHCTALLNRPQELLDMARRCQVAFDALPHDFYTIGAMQNMGSALELCGHLAPAEAMLHRAQAAYRAWDDPGGVADAQCFSSVCAHQMGRIDEAAELLQRGRQVLAEINGGRAEVHTADIYQGRYWRDQGRLAEALALLEDGHRRTAQHGEINLHAGLCIELGLTYLALGQTHRVHALVVRPRQVPKLQVQLEGLLLEAELAAVEARAPLPFIERAQALVPQCPRAQRYGWRVAAALSAFQPAEQAVPLLQTVIDEARAAQTWSHEGPARVRLVEAFLSAGQVAAAHRQATALARLLEMAPPMMLQAGEYYWALACAFESAGDVQARRDILRTASQRIETQASLSVPDAFRDSFLNRNPFNRQLRAAAGRLVA